MMDPFHILPFEMWEELLDRLDHPQDKLNLVRTNSRLENAFHSKILTWQLPAVLPILAEHGRMSNTSFFNAALLQSRQLSFSCCLAIDNYIDSHWNKFLCPPSFTDCSYNLWNLDQAAHYWNQIENHPPHRSPLLSQLFSTLWVFPGDIDEDTLILKKLISKVGKHLRGVRWTAEITHEIGASCHYLSELISFTPNLQLLDLNFPIRYVNIANAVAREDIALPPLPNLQRLEVAACVHATATSPASWLNFKTYFPQLVELRMHFSIWKDQYNQQKGIIFPKLKRLRIDSIMLPEAEEKAYKFVQNLDTPNLEELIMDSQECLTDHFDKSAYFLKRLTLFTLRKSREGCHWNVSEMPTGYGYEYKFCAVLN